MPYLLGIDIGTTGVKTLLIDERGETVASCTVPHPLYTPRPGWTEQDPEDWWKGTVTSVQEVLRMSGVDPGAIAGIGLSGQMHSSVFLDRKDRVIRPAILWNDGRTTPQCRWMTELAGEENLRRWVANPALEGFTAPKVIWLRENEPENYRKVRTLLLPKDYVRFRLTGEKATEYSDAAGTLFLDVRNRRWSKEMLEALDIPEDILPPVYESVDVCGKVTKEAAELTGLKPGTPVVGGGADNACGATGAGVVREGRVLSSIGTSGTVVAPSKVVQVDPEMRAHTFCHSVPGMWYVMGVVLSAGGSLRWFKDALGQLEKVAEELTGVDAYDLLTKEAQRAEPGSEGLVFLPYITGERTPHRDADARGVFFGLSARHTRAHLVRAVLEGITFAMRDSLEIIRGLGIRVEEIRATGGGAKSPFWRQLQADVYGAPVYTPTNTEGPAFGAALMAGVGAGLFHDLADAADELVHIATTAEPDSERVRVYDEFYGIFRSLYPALKERFSETAELVRSKVAKGN
ncbi:MAG: xylulokinase [Candidatus Latescibacterota bacterium]|nr:MAG: xylulokinase [Candidatus Latescibacterota bacterium]